MPASGRRLGALRVPLNTVEAALLELEGVREAAVVAHGSGPGERRLVAHVAPAAAGPEQLRRALATALPPHMVPQVFVCLDALPRTGSGKVDRGELPAPGRTRPALDTPFAPPRDEVEHLLASVWATVLELEAVGIDDQFRDLGGDSLAAMWEAALVMQAAHVAPRDGHGGRDGDRGARLRYRSAARHDHLAATDSLTARRCGRMAQAMERKRSPARQDRGDPRLGHRIMNRRSFLVGVGALLAAAGAGEAQPHSKPALIGLLPLGSSSNSYDRSLVEAFQQGLREAGALENRDFVLEVIWTSGEAEVLSAVVKLVQRGVRLLIPVGTTASMAVKRQAPTTSMLFISVGNPIGIGLVGSLARPGGHVTGFGDALAELGSKYLQFAVEVGKPQSVVHYIWHAGWTDGQYRLQVTERAAQTLGVKFRSSAFTDISEVDHALGAMKKSGASVVIVQPSPFTFRERGRLIDIAMRHRLATIFAFRPAADAGALITYGPDYADLNRRAASYVARILKGTRPGDLPVEQPTKFEMRINLKTAKSLGLTIPPSLLSGADQVIE